MKTTMTALLAGAAMISAASAATTLTNQLLVNFDGSLAGTTYTLGAGEIDTTGTFAGSGTASVAGGKATVGGGTDGFQLDPTTIGNLTTQNWVAESIVTFNSFGGGQLTVIDVQGDTDFRINNNGAQFQIGYWDGGSYPEVSGALPATATPVHLAMVWDAASTSLTAYIDGVSVGVADGNAFATPDTSNISFGYFGRAGFEGRGIDGELDGAAFSTFTGSFDANNDFQLTAVPEPSSAVLLGLGGLALILRRRK